MCSINHDKKSIFIHIPKSGGSYICDILRKYYGFKNYYIKRPDHNKFCNEIDYSTKTHENKSIGTLLYYKTSPHLNKIMNMDQHKWNTYFIFTFVRNPYDRFISGWNYVNKNNIPFDKFIELGKNTSSWNYWHVFISQLQHIIDLNNTINIKFIGKLENIEDDLKTVLTKIGFSNIIHQPSKKNTTEHKDFKEYYLSNSILNKVNQYIYQDLIFFKYKKANDIIEL
jgi:hypothetical protein